MGVCVPNFRSVSFFVWPGYVTHIHTQINTYTRQGDMRKIHVTRQFIVSSGRHGDFFEKTKNPFLDKVNGSMCAEFQVCIVVSVARRRDTNTYIHKYTEQLGRVVNAMLYLLQCRKMQTQVQIRIGPWPDRLEKWLGHCTMT